MNADDILTLRDEAVAAAKSVDTLDAIEQIRIKYIGSKGLLRDIMAALKEAPRDKKRSYGQNANLFRAEVTAAIHERKQMLAADSEKDQVDCFDYTLPGRWRGLGSLHPITQIEHRIIRIFSTMGFTVADGPDIETVFNNFDALNTPPTHPSRDPQDTFYLENGDVLRTHTSTVQIRYMQNQPPPVRIIAPGRCYRRDTADATHSANFHQVEGLYVADGVSLADLKGDLSYFAQELMGPDVKIRFRPHFFPFTEPSVEVDFSCHLCKGDGCRVCKHSGWIEILGAGMVDPEVFKAVGYDPEQVTGYAFGMGMERIAMVLFGIQDIRKLYENDLRFLEQFA